MIGGEWEGVCCFLWWQAAFNLLLLAHWLQSETSIDRTHHGPIDGTMDGTVDATIGGPIDDTVDGTHYGPFAGTHVEPRCYSLNFDPTSGVEFATKSSDASLHFPSNAHFAQDHIHFTE